jgi:universal stress protein G
MNETMAPSTAPLICYVDLPTASATALTVADAIARTRGAELHVLQVQPADGPADASPRAGDEALTTVVARMQSAGMKVVVMSETGEAEDAVKRYLQHHTPDLFVTEKDARRNRKWLGLEVLAIDDVYAASCPTLLVSPNVPGSDNGEAFGFNQVVCAADLSTGWVAAVEQAGRLVQPRAGRLTLLHVLDQYPRQTVYSGARAMRLVDEHRSLVANLSEQMRTAVSNAVSPATPLDVRVVTGTPNHVILEAAQELEADLIVLGIRPERIVDRILFGSTSRSVIRRSECSVLTVPMADVEASTASEKISGR